MADSLYTRLGDEKIPCRVCGKPIWGITQHRKDKHPEVSKRAWSKLGDWKGPPTPSQPPLVQEPLSEHEWVAQVVSSGQYDFPLLQWRSAEHSLNTAIGTKLYAASPAGVQGDGVPAIVIQWRDAYGSYIAAMDAYNDRVQYIRDREAKRLTEFGRDNPTGEWRAVDAASAKWHSLLRPMFEALAALPAGRAGAEGGDAAGGNEVDRG